jgi:hypothetical protein
MARRAIWFRAPRLEAAVKVNNMDGQIDYGQNS